MPSEDNYVIEDMEISPIGIASDIIEGKESRQKGMNSTVSNWVVGC